MAFKLRVVDLNAFIKKNAIPYFKKQLEIAEVIFSIELLPWLLRVLLVLRWLL